jgi:LysM repeat protein
MESDREIEQEDFDEGEEEITEDQDQYRRDIRRRTQKPSGGSIFRLRYIFIIAIVAVILIIVFMRSGKSLSDEQISSIAAEMAIFKNQISELDAKLGTLQESYSELEKSDAIFSQRIDTLDKRLIQNENKNSSPPESIRSSEKNVEKSAAPKSKKSYYEVKRGDTLFSVAKKHGISIEKLQALNGMGKNKSISVGQKLLIER